MWWHELGAAPPPCAKCGPTDCVHVDPTASVSPDAILDCSAGPIRIGRGTRICAGAHVQGPVTIGSDCLVGNLALVRGCSRIGDGSRIGFAAEVKNAILGKRVSIGPQCFVADSRIDDDAYLGAQVRTSNHRLDKRTVQVLVDGELIDSGLDKLGCLIGARAALGIQVIVLPGRTVAADSLIGPRITVEKNLPPGRYRLAQTLETY